MPQLLTGLMNMSQGVGHIAVLNQYFADVLEAQDEAFTVWVLGGETRLGLALSREIPDGGVLGALGTRVDDAADRLVHDLLSVDEQVLSGEQDRLAWSSSLLGDRGLYAGDLQLNAARYMVMDEIIRTGGRHVFFVEDDVVAQALEKTARCNGLSVTRRGGKVATPKRVETLRARASVMKQYWRQSRLMKKLRRTHPAPWDALAECDVLVVDWAGANSFNPDGETTRWGNMVRMADVLRKGGLTVGFIAYPLSWTQSFEAIAENVARAHDPVVMMDECRGVGSVVRGAWATWRMSKRLKKARFHAQGLDLSPLFNVERIKDKIRPQSTMAYSLVDVAMSLAVHGVRPKTIVLPYENQGFEHALIAGIRSHLLDTRVVSYQHAPLAERNIGQFPAPSNIAAGRLADMLIVMGSFTASLMKKFSWPAERLTIGGSLRFEPALDNPPNPASGGDGKTILAATSIDFGEALDLVVKGGMAIKAIPDASLVVNFHPVVENSFKEGIKEDLRKSVGDDVMARVALSDDRSSELIAKADVLLYNSSGAVFDACFCGVPVVHVGVDGRLSYDKVPGKVSLRVYREDDLVDALNRIFASLEKTMPDLSVGGVIAPVDERTIVNAVRGL